MKTHPLVLALAVLLALATAWLSIVAMGKDATEAAGYGTGVYEADDVPRVQSLIERMSQALIAMQREDGSFDPGPDGGVQNDQERLAADALATAALVTVKSLGTAYETPYLDDACDRGLEWLRKNQADDGRIGPEAIGPDGRYWQVDATSAAMLAFVESADVQSLRALKKAGPVFATFSEEGFRNGWSRALAAMTVDRVYAANRQNVFPEDARKKRIVRGRQVGERRDHHDMAVSEAIVRVVLRGILGQGTMVADTYPEEILAACLENPPRWKNLTADMQLWWMQAWLVRQAAAEAVPWFHDLVLALDEEALEDDGRVPGGYYATSLVQTSAAILALIEGLRTQVTS